MDEGKHEGTELLLTCRPHDQNRRVHRAPMNAVLAIAET